LIDFPGISSTGSNLDTHAGFIMNYEAPFLALQNQIDMMIYLTQFFLMI
jgi:hypothetical protein